MSDFNVSAFDISLSSSPSEDSSFLSNLSFSSLSSNEESLEENNSFEESSVFSDSIPLLTSSNEENINDDRHLALYMIERFWQKIEEGLIEVDDEKFVFPLDLFKKSTATKCFTTFLNFYSVSNSSEQFTYTWIC